MIQPMAPADERAHFIKVCRGDFGRGSTGGPTRLTFARTGLSNPRARSGSTSSWIKWWSRVFGQTDARGASSNRCFLGDYEITVTHNGKSKTLRTTLEKRERPGGGRARVNGAPISRCIVENLAGRLWAKANDGPGASFQIIVPVQPSNGGPDG